MNDVRPLRSRLSQILPSTFVCVAIAAALSIALQDDMVAQTKNKNWEAPKQSKTVVNPIPATKVSLVTGKSLFKTNCVACHGNRGKGDGPAAIALKPRPKDLSSAEIARQEDGELHWKISHGKSPMPAFNAMKREQVWHVINYIRTLGPERPAKTKKPPHTRSKKTGTTKTSGNARKSGKSKVRTPSSTTGTKHVGKGSARRVASESAK